MTKRLHHWGILFLALLLLPVMTQAQNIVTVGTQTGAAAANALLSTSTTGNKYSKTISIYTAASLIAAGAAPGNILKLAWSKQGTGEYTTADLVVDVYMKHVTNSTWPSGGVTWATEVTGATQVYSSTTWSFPTGTGWVEIPLTTPFAWNGTDNIAVFVDFYRPGTPTADITWAYETNTATNATQVGSSAVSNLGILNANRPLIRMEFASTIPDDAGVASIPLPTPAATPGTYDLTAVVRNYGTQPLNAVGLNWEVDGVSQLPLSPIFIPPLATGSVNTEALGSAALGNGVHTIKAWTVNPNGVADGFNGNDTSTRTFTLASGGYTVGATGDFLNLTAVAAFLNSGSVFLTGDVTFTLLSDYDGLAETLPVSFNAFNKIGGNWVVKVHPAAGVTGRVTAGTPASSIPLIIFNGVDGLTLDGRPGGTGTSIEWTLRNMRASTTYSPAVRFVGEATYDTLRYLQIESGNTSTTAAAGGTVQFSTATTGTTGNSFNMVANCYIRDRSDVAGVPAIAIASNGTATAPNIGNAIVNNRIANFTNSGINLGSAGNGDAWTISNNHIYCTNVATGAQTGISVSATGNGYAINDNFIGGTDVSAGGTPWTSSGANLWSGISASFGTSAMSYITGNVIANVSRTSTTGATFSGIRVTGGPVTIQNNTIGDPNLTGSISSTGTGLMAGIEVKNTTAATEVLNNTVAGISSLGTGTGIVRGISYDPSTPFAVTISNNQIANLSTTGNSTGFTGGSVTISGIYAFSTGYSPASTIANNMIHDITAANSSTAVTIAAGMMLTNFAGNISGNRIYNIGSASTAPASAPSYVAGIYSRFLDPGVFSNNMISLGAGVANNVQVNGVMITGGDPSPGGTHFYYHNTIHLSNNNSATSNVIKRGEVATLTTTHPIRFINNILSNEINAAGTHLVYNNPIATPSLNWTSSDTNVVYAAGGNFGQWGATVYNLADWRTTALQDVNSKMKQVAFVSPATGNLHLTTASEYDMDLAGTYNASFSADIDNETRANPPYVGADELANAPLPVDFISISAVALGADSRVSWSVGREKEISGYAVEASTNGSAFMTVGKIAAANSEANHTYSLLHKDAAAFAGAPGVVYYRVKATGLDGRDKYSSVVKLAFARDQQETASVYPNPARDQFTLELYLPVPSAYSYVITDLTGKPVIRKSGKGHGSLLLQEEGLKQLPAGVYQLKLEAGGKNYQFRIVHQ